MKVLYEPIIDCIIKHSVKILIGNYDNSKEVFDYANFGIYPPKVAALAESFGMMMVKLEARDLALNHTIDQLRAKEQEIRHLYQAFVETIVAAVDARDAATAGHSKRVANYAIRFCQAVNDTDCGKYQCLQFSESEIKELYYAALLHDVGKIGINENILLKKHRLSDNRIAVIEYRFKYYKQCLQLKHITGILVASEVEMLEKIDDYYRFIAEINGREYISLEEAQQIKKIAEMEFINEDGTASKILDDFETQNLVIRRGNLTDAERCSINMHATYTAEILGCLPWEYSMQKVATIATGHHEKLDGSGYPKGLIAEDIPVQTRMLAMIDIYDALTAFDRTYKPPIAMEEAIMILGDEVILGRLDKDLFEIFCERVIR